MYVSVSSVPASLILNISPTQEEGGHANYSLHANRYVTAQVHQSMTSLFK